MRADIRSEAGKLLREHQVVLVLALAYLAVGGYLQTGLLHRPWPIQVTTTWFAAVWLAGSVLWVVTHLVRRRLGPRAPLSLNQLLAALLLASLAVPVQITFQALKQSLGHVRGFPWDARLAAIDEALHGGPAWRVYAFVLEQPMLLKTIDILYLLWFVMLMTTLVWLCWTNVRAIRERALVALLLLWVGAGTIGAWIFASAGPCFTAASSPGAADLLARLAATHSALLALQNQRGVWEGFVSDRWLPFGGVSAMPSLHVGLAVLVALIAWRRHRWMGAALWAYAVAMQVGSVILAWHYGIDGYAGALCAWGAWAGAGRLVRGDNGERPRPRTVTVERPVHGSE